MTVPAAKRKRPPSITKEIAAIVKAGLLPKIVHRPDGTVELTGLPRESVDSPTAEENLTPLERWRRKKASGDHAA